MESTELPPSFERLPLSRVIRFHTYAPTLSDEASPVIIAREAKMGERENSDRGWRGVATLPSRCFYPPAPSERAFTLGNRMISHGLGWERYEIEYVPIPSGYEEWGAAVLTRHGFNLKGDGEGVDYIYGAVYCSLGRYSISPSLLKFLLQTWNPETNTFISVDGERTITLLDMLRIGGLPIDGEFYEEFVPSRSERDPSLLSYPSILYRDF